jgi:hypothetical protein
VEFYKWLSLRIFCSCGVFNCENESFKIAIERRVESESSLNRAQFETRVGEWNEYRKFSGTCYQSKLLKEVIPGLAKD